MSSIVIEKEKKLPGGEVVEGFNKVLTKKPPKRKRVLSFEDIDDPVLVEQTQRHIDDVKEELKDGDIISLTKWCQDSGMDELAVTQLLKDANLSIIKIGDSWGVLQLHLTRVLYEESARQFEQQCRNRACARVLALRQHRRFDGHSKKSHKF